jgi:hypothetical protein
MPCSYTKEKKKLNSEIVVADGIFRRANVIIGDVNTVRGEALVSEVRRSSQNPKFAPYPNSLP